jgi:hypothetical protein
MLTTGYSGHTTPTKKCVRSEQRASEKTLATAGLVRDNAVVSISRCNTRSEPQVQEFKELRLSREHKSKEKASCLGKGELQPKGSVRLKRIARSNDQRDVASTVSTGTTYQAVRVANHVG